MNWLTVAARIAGIVLLAAMLGWYLGYVLEAVVVALIALLAFWQYQIQRVQSWLNEPGRPPPDVYGIWGELVSRIYQHQRRHMEARAQLQSTVEYLQDSFAAIRDGVVMVDEQGVIKWFNRAAEPLLGLQFPDDRGQTLTNLVREPEFNSYFLAQDYSEPLQYQVTAGVDQSFVRVEITHFGEGERVLFIRDVSNAVRLEQMRRDFVANVSHELRTPLTVISGYLNTFLSGSVDFPAQFEKPLKQMEQQSERMESLVEDLLWLSRIEAERQNEPTDTVEVGALLQELQEELKEAFPDSAVNVEVETARNIEGDYKKLYSAVSNLAINALKYSDNGSPITMSWQSTGDKGILKVQDKGVGIDSVHIPRLTERFYRVDDSRNTATGGTGLGLAIVKHVAATHGAHLQVDSKLGEGSTFSLEFPLRG